MPCLRDGLPETREPARIGIAEGDQFHRAGHGGAEDPDGIGYERPGLVQDLDRHVGKLAPVWIADNWLLKYFGLCGVR